ncbi:hypothetical protein [Candidatus Nanohalovita haloferacivicina]|uniref:hypothetical protein n=1 Tax=Candidatus Nanohalovita haloferacivicina TaxID=2978046 RepID=UPI00325FB4AC|nr:hypothetical protein HBNXNv_1003 [Candidatus Nanohalobia archaeon BNXNv]
MSESDEENVDRFRSDLGEVAVTKNHVERRRSESDDWENIDKNFSEQKLVDYVSFDEIEDLEFEEGSIYPNIRIKTDGEWKRLFFHVGDQAYECFKTLRYRWSSYRQLY